MKSIEELFRGGCRGFPLVGKIVDHKGHKGTRRKNKNASTDSRLVVAAN